MTECLYCGNEVQEDHEFCLFCGHSRLRSTTSQLGESAISIPSRLESVGWALLGLGFMALLALLVMGIFKGVGWVAILLVPISHWLSGTASLVLFAVLLPSAILKQNRTWCGKGMVWVSYTWGLGIWFFFDGGSLPDLGVGRAILGDGSTRDRIGRLIDDCRSLPRRLLFCWLSIAVTLTYLGFALVRVLGLH